MSTFFTTSIGRLRLIAFLEGISLLVLIFVAVPLKYMAHDPSWVKAIGPVHGILFVLFVFSTLKVSLEQRWPFRTVTWKVLLACFIPFGTFYIDSAILKKLPKQ